MRYIFVSAGLLWKCNSFRPSYAWEFGFLFRRPRTALKLDGFLDFFGRASFFSFLAQDFGGSFGSDTALRGIWTRGISVRGVLLVGSGPQTRGKLDFGTFNAWGMGNGSVLDTGPETVRSWEFGNSENAKRRLILDPGRVEFRVIFYFELLFWFKKSVFIILTKTFRIFYFLDYYSISSDLRVVSSSDFFGYPWTHGCY
ncbi:unnamed protein product [Rhizophagus irregularis]|nr:unnamed protein product [Rhizophagus irregularis]